MCRAGNLGSLSKTVEQVGTPDFTLPDLDAFQPGVHFDGLAISGSLILLVVLLGIALERVLGLDRFLVDIATKWKFEKLARERRKELEDRARLERMYEKDNE